MKLVIGNKNYSSWSLRPWLLLKHFNIAFEEERIALYIDNFEAQLSGYNSDDKVPVLEDKGLIIWDSLAILEYISEQYLDGKGWPKDYKARAIARSMSNEMHSSFSHIRNKLPMNCRKTFDSVELSVEAQKEVTRIQFLWHQCREKYKDEGEWLFGDFSIADAMFAPIAIRFLGYNISLSDLNRQYVESVINDRYIVDWIQDSRLEPEIISMAEK